MPVVNSSTSAASLAVMVFLRNASHRATQISTGVKVRIPSASEIHHRLHTTPHSLAAKRPPAIRHQVPNVAAGSGDRSAVTLTEVTSSKNPSQLLKREICRNSQLAT